MVEKFNGSGHDVVHENDNYVVIVDDELEFSIMGTTYLGGYAIVNRHTGIVEFMTMTMPEALFTSEQLNHSLLSKAWEWRKEKKEEEGPEAVDTNRIVN